MVALDNAIVAVEVAPEFQRFSPAAILKLASQHDWLISESDGQIVVAHATGALESTIRKSVQYALYREKIYDETLPMRLALVQAVTSS